MSVDSEAKTTEAQDEQLYSTFKVKNRLYGISVHRVQEVVKSMPITPVPHAPAFVSGLINLRGQIATAIGVGTLFGIGSSATDQMMNIVCNIDQNLVALQVDEIGDVLEVGAGSYEPPPSTIPEEIRSLLSGVHKIDDALLSIIDMDRVAERVGIRKS